MKSFASKLTTEKLTGIITSLRRIIMAHDEFLNLFRDVGLEAFAQDIGGIILNGVIPSMVDGA